MFLGEYDYVEICGFSFGIVQDLCDRRCTTSVMRASDNSRTGHETLLCALGSNWKIQGRQDLTITPGHVGGAAPA